jgi:hypothetical protein
MSETITITTPDGSFAAYLSRPAVAPAPSGGAMTGKVMPGLPAGSRYAGFMSASLASSR